MTKAPEITLRGPVGQPGKLTFRSFFKILLLGRLLLAAADDDAHSGAGHQQDTQQAVHPHTAITGGRQIEAAGIDHSQRSMGILGTVVLQHVDIIAINSCGSGQQVMLQLLLGHVVQDVGQAAIGLHVALGDSLADDSLCVPGIVLNQANYIRLVDVTDLNGFNLGNYDLNVIPQQGVAVISTDFSCSVGVIFQTLDEDNTLAVCVRNRDEVSCFGLIGSMAGDVVDTLFHVQLGNDKVVVGIVMDDELDILEVTLAVREQLGQFDAVGE